MTDQRTVGAGSGGGAAVEWRGLYWTGAIAALVTLAFFVIQMAVFLAHPPPQSAAGFFDLFRRNGLLGLLSMDLLSLADYVLTGLVVLALCAAMWRASPSLSAVALALELVAISTYLASNTAFSMLSLSGQYERASSDVERTALLGAGQAMLAVYQGTAFDVSYVLSAVPLLLVSVLMLKSGAFGKGTAYIGLGMGVLMLLPPTAGRVGMVASLASLVPLAAWLVLVALQLHRLARGSSPGRAGLVPRRGVIASEPQRHGTV